MQLVCVLGITFDAKYNVPHVQQSAHNDASLKGLCCTAAVYSRRVDDTDAVVGVVESTLNIVL